MAVIFWFYPVITSRTRVEALLAVLFFLGGLLVVVWSIKAARWPMLAFYLLAGIFLILPARLPQIRSGLRNGYVEALKAYSGTTYVWGGEGRFGIDCSGLVRKGLEDALASQSIYTLNPRLIRESNSLYWNDTTAKVIGEGYFGRTYEITICPSLNSLDYTQLLPGDLAVTTDGTHVMAYLGNKTWIAADPGEGKVVSFTIPEKNNAYFSRPMRIVRWKILAN